MSKNLSHDRRRLRFETTKYGSHSRRFNWSAHRQPSVRQEIRRLRPTSIHDFEGIRPPEKRGHNFALNGHFRTDKTEEYDA